MFNYYRYVENTCECCEQLDLLTYLLYSTLACAEYFKVLYK